MLTDTFVGFGVPVSEVGHASVTEDVQTVLYYFHPGCTLFYGTLTEVRAFEQLWLVL